VAAIAFESQEAHMVCDANWVILRVNQAFTQVTGFSAAEAIGKLPQRLLGSTHTPPEFYLTIDDTLLQQGRWQGEIWDRRKSGEVFPAWVQITAVRDDDGHLTHFVVSMDDITQRKADEEQIRSLAFYDPLTQLPNRRLLMDRLEVALATCARHPRMGALLFVDLDNFKTLNDTLGHDIGDLLLQQVAERLKSCVREGDTVARLGGDEFVIMLEDLANDAIDAATQAEAVGEKILQTLGRSYVLRGHTHRSTPSIGVTLFGDRVESIEEPLKRADVAMYQSKAAGRNALRFFDPGMQAAVSNRVALEADLRDAIAQKQFVLHFQPQIQAKPDGSLRVVGAEALVRWQHPERGMVSPAEFIPLAEETGLIVPLGQWVLESACRQLARWQGHPELGALTLAVNVSARQFLQNNFVAQVGQALEATGARPSLLKLELTESTLVGDINEVVRKMTELQSWGVGFALDDFGTGYSSLAYLKRMPLDTLKIDQSFVRDVFEDANDAAIARMVVVLGRSLGLTVIAEGVETLEQRYFLAQQGCHVYQGYLFGKPQPVQEFQQMVLEKTYVAS
jgi:diguanylate cyclase (GGDEF)-like protein/PAS domain S-box-containing protein